MSKFEELRDKRLPAAVHKIGLLGNLGRPSYGASHAERARIVHTLAQAVEEAARRLRVPVDTRPAPRPPERPAGVPPGEARGGASFEHEVRWAIDAIDRGDLKLARDRLARCLDG